MITPQQNAVAATAIPLKHLATSKQAPLKVIYIEYYNITTLVNRCITPASQIQSLYEFPFW